MKRFIAALLLTLAISLFLNGCAGTSAQRVVLTSASMSAQTVNSAYDSWAAYAIAEAKTRLPNATPEELSADVQRSETSRSVMLRYNQWRAAMLAFSAANAAAASGTNSTALATESFRINVAKSGNSLLELIGQLTGKPQPKLVP